MMKTNQVILVLGIAATLGIVVGKMTIPQTQPQQGNTNLEGQCNQNGN